MKKLLNTLYITTPRTYLSLDGENIIATKEDKSVSRFPLHNIEGIVGFGFTGVSPALMGKCADMGISLTFMTMHGRFLGRIVGEEHGNVLLRKEQFRISESSEKRPAYAKNMITAKLINSRNILLRAKRDYGMRIDVEKIETAAEAIRLSANEARKADSADTLRGIEGNAANCYFHVFDDLVLQQKNDFYFHGRNKRPPLDNVNALLSFTYTLLAKDVTSALESVGLDPYVGFLHTDLPGRTSLALDLMEELRSILADRFVLSLINMNIVSADGFTKTDSGAVYMDDNTRKTVLSSWQKKKQETIKHPFLDQKIEWGFFLTFRRCYLLEQFAAIYLNIHLFYGNNKKCLL